MCDLLHAAPFQNILPRVYIKGIEETQRRHLGFHTDLCVMKAQRADLFTCVSVLFRGRATRGKDEAAGSKVCPSAPRASN